jgi:hypothetical protein
MAFIDAIPWPMRESRSSISRGPLEALRIASTIRTTSMHVQVHDVGPC